MNRITRHVAAWIACFAILLAALAPSVSLALSVAHDSGASWVEVCSAQGSKFVKVDGKQSGTPWAPAKAMQAEHCPFCLTHAGSMGLPPAAGFLLSLPNGTPMRPTLYFQSPRPLFIWAAPQSRAPPALS
jgi:hypothetical protein